MDFGMLTDGTFYTSQLVKDHELEQKQDLNHPKLELKPEPEPEPKPDSLNSKQQHQGIQEPLDENLFSDLVLQTPLDQPKLQPEAKHEPEPGPPSATAFARQTFSTFQKKRKATGFRIGYGRDHQINNIDADGHGLCDSELHQGQAQQQQQQQQQQSVDDAESRFEQIKARIFYKLHHAHELAVSVSAARKDFIRRRRKAADELEKQLEDACEAEDFETADRINESLAAADNDKQSLLTALRDAKAQCNAIDSKMLEVLNCPIAVEEECATLLHGFSENAMSNADSVFKKSEAQSSEEREKWLSSTEALQLNKIELQIEAHLVDNARATFNTSLDSLIEDDKREKEFLCNQKDILTDELQKLIALVKKKEKEIAENDSKMKQVDERIADTISGFQEMQSSIDSKYESLQSHLSQMEIDSETLSKKKEEIDKLLAEEKKKGLNSRNLPRFL
ncbi:hypothetical protein J1N35_028525 [Gossypium stocksii]|uniref:UVR domain-containing protein n=1 Tax=Gossypium stocksii TaxID=47602 RepID=A0A9D3UWF5_9ROSI|nr:hypothetical protein J1N35_028525 [Gossypium stocksii]